VRRAAPRVVDLCRHEDLVVDRFELLTQKRFLSLARQVADDIRSVSPETQVELHDVLFRPVESANRSPSWRRDLTSLWYSGRIGRDVARLVETRALPLNIVNLGRVQ
jgi:hypothetical protein